MLILENTIKGLKWLVIYKFIEVMFKNFNEYNDLDNGG